MIKWVVLPLNLFLMLTACFAAPCEIIIIRHADKLSTHPGMFLSAKGQLRAERFVNYYLTTFPVPDFIFATKPEVPGTTLDYIASARPLQTVMPLANALQEQTSRTIYIYYPYSDEEGATLAQDLLRNPQYEGKVILICWQHSRINLLANALGVKDALEKWPEDIYDMVYVLKYNTDEELTAFQILKNQYPVDENPDWKELGVCNKVNSI